jgi:Zn-dependent M28 family amino/carboxypeptidase
MLNRRFPAVVVSVLGLSLSLTSLFLRADGGVDPALLEQSKLLIAEVTQKGEAYANLKELTAIGPRLSGSAGAAKAVQWARAKMESYGFDKVWLQPVTVPSWDRGKLERASLLPAAGTPAQALAVTALGGSIGTPAGGVQAQVVEVGSLEEVEALGSAVKGKIVFYNKALDPALDDKFEAYSQVTPLRSAGASVAARHGAVATLIRSLSTLPDDDHPHTGVMRYQKQVAKIPAGALSTRAANTLSAGLKKDPSLRVRLELGASAITSAPSHNVIGEITGSELPGEVFVLGGHLDSWDLGTGAHDDGAGVVQSLEVLRAIKALGIKPKRTLRVVLFMSEEFGAAGAYEYAKLYASQSQERFIGALESDRGGFAPTGFSVSGDEAIQKRLSDWKPYFALNGADLLVPSEGGGVDTAPLGELGVPEFELLPVSTHYFDLHHSALDVLSAVDPVDLAQAAASMAILSSLAVEQGL